METMRCTVTNDYELEGAYTSPNFKYLSARMLPCTGSDSCKNETQIKEYITGKEINLLYTDTYMDRQNSYEVLQEYVKDNFYTVIYPD